MMTERTHEARVQQLFALVELHPHRDELIQLMEEQLIDDSNLNANTCGD
jgi:hypothetical protein